MMQKKREIIKAKMIDIKITEITKLIGTYLRKNKKLFKSKCRMCNQHVVILCM